MKIAVMGSGGWGTALALVLLENGHEVTLWSYAEEESRVLRESGENPMLKGVPLPAALGLTSDQNCVKDCGVVVLLNKCDLDPAVERDRRQRRGPAQTDSSSGSCGKTSTGECTR